MFLATINTPGYLPWDDDPPVFETCAEAWDYLRDQHAEMWNDVEFPDSDPDDMLPQPFRDIYQTMDSRMAGHAAASHNHGVARCYGEHTPTPGRTWDDPTDLGLVFCVTSVEVGA